MIDNYLENKVSLDCSGSICLQDINGVFYLIQLEPTHDPGRFKVGFTNSIQERIRSHKCSAPLLRLIDSWPCKCLWEKTAIDCVTAGCERIHTEVFRAISIEHVKQKCDNFFSIMPEIMA